jgi:hypothetical protein
LLVEVEVEKVVVEQVAYAVLLVQLVVVVHWNLQYIF